MIWGLALVLTVTAVPAALGAIVFFGADPVEAGHVAPSVLLVSLGVLAFSPLLPSFSGKRALFDRVRDVSEQWLWISGTVHVTWELGWCLVHRHLHGITANDTWAWAWWAYGVADKRYLVSDPFIVIMEWCVALISGPLTFYAIYLIRRGRLKAAAVVGLITAVIDWYGDVCYFGTEYFNDFRSIDVDNPINLYVKFIGYNALWIILPMIGAYVAVKDLLLRPASSSEAPS